MDENIQATLSYNRANMEWKNGWKFLLVGCSQILNHTATPFYIFLLYYDSSLKCVSKHLRREADHAIAGSVFILDQQCLVLMTRMHCTAAYR